MEILEGYSVAEWPDLSGNRHPSNQPHTSKEELSGFDVKDNKTLLLVCVARILGTYCSASDIILGVRLPEDHSDTFIRVCWSEGDTWQEVASKVTLRSTTDAKKLNLEDIRHAVDFSQKQYPCPALVQFTYQKEAGVSPGFPAIFSFDGSSSSLVLSAPGTLLHPSINQQIVRQVAALFSFARSHGTDLVVANPPLAPHLMSIFTRIPDDELSREYPHIPQVTFATEYLNQRAKSHPNSVAVRWYPELDSDEPNPPCEEITYAGLDRKAHQLARWLVAQGLRQEDRVAVCLSRNILFHAALVGIMRAGGCYVPIDPELPLERKAYIARDSGARFVLTTSDLSPPTLFGPKSVFVDATEVLGAIEQESTNEFNIAKLENLSYMLYTSGTTGNPKGCLLTNHGLAQAIFALSSTAADVRMEDLSRGRYLAVASIAFDVHLAETIVPMALGMPLLSAPRSQLLENLPEYVKTLGVTHLGIVPSLIEATLNASKDGGGGMALRYIASGGEKMSDSILDKWANHHQVRLANFYGPSEVTIGCCARYMDSNTPRANIGTPFANVSAYVVDPDLSILPRGGIGELVVEGPLVGRGYHGRPDLTQKAFLEWPEKGCWAYRTGDLVRMMPDSTIEILGRIDTQIKLRGVRIESEGISAIVRKAKAPSPDIVLDATTVLAKHPSLGGEQLVTFVTWEPNVPISKRKSVRPTLSAPPKGLLKSIRSICRDELASYMRPSHVIPLNWLPLSSNGKTDGKILVDVFKRLDVSEIAGLMSDEDTPCSKGCTNQELRLFEVLKRHAPSCPPTPNPDIVVFECGLDSMGLIRFTSDLKSTFGKAIKVTDVMKTPSLRDIASLVEASASHLPSSTASSYASVDDRTRREVLELFRPRVVEDVLPPFPVQEGVLSRSAEDTSLYVQHVILQLKGDTTPARLRQSWESVVATHTILRTVFHVDRLAAQVVLRSHNFSAHWAECTFGGNTHEELKEHFYSSLAGRICRDINEGLSTVPPFRITLFRGATSKFIILSIHHALYDGTSLPFLLKDVERSYLGLERIPVASLSAILASIGHHDMDSAREFWTSHFRDFVWPQPAAAKLTASHQHKIKYLSLPFQRKLSAVREIANKSSVTLQAFLSFVFGYLISSQLYQTRDVAFGVIRSGRMLPVDNIDVALCPTITVIPMRIRLGDGGFTLKDVQAVISSMAEHEHVPLGKIQSWLRPGAPIFEVLFSASVQQHEDSEIWDPCPYEPPAADYPLSVEAVANVDEDSLVLRAAWLEGVITDAQVDDLLQGFELVTTSLERGEELAVATSASNLHRNSEQPARDGGFEDHVSVEPQVLEQLRQTVADFLEVPSTALTSTVSFISLGLDSIRAVGLAKRIRKQGYDISSSDVLKAATIERLYQLAVNRRPKKNPDIPTPQYAQMVNDLIQRVPIAEILVSPDDDPKVFPTTALQSGMLSQTIGSDGHLYIHSFPLVLSEDTDTRRLKLAWEEAAKMIDILRTSFYFIPDTGRWAQIVHSSSELKWSTADLPEDADHAISIRAFVDSIECTDEFAFSSPPIWLRLFNSESKHSSILVLVMHHALYDGISIEKLLVTVQNLYRGQEVSSTTQFTDLLPSFFRQESEGVAFWTSRLADFGGVLLSQGTQGENLTHTSVKPVNIDVALLNKLLKASEATPQCLLQAALAHTLAKLTKSEDVVFGHVVSGRGEQGAEDVIGPTLNTIPCRVRLSIDMSARGLLQSIHRSNMETSAWQQVSLRSLHKALGIDRLWDCLFTFQPLSEEGSADNIWQIAPVSERDIHIQYPIHVEVEQTAAGFLLRCASRASALDQAKLTEFVEDLRCTLLSWIDNPDKEIGFAVPGDKKPLEKDAQITPAPPSLKVSPTGGRIHPVLSAAIRAFAPDMEITPNTPVAALGIDSITAIQISGKCRQSGLRLSATQILSSQTVKDLIDKASESTLQVKLARPVELYHDLSEAEKQSIAHRFGGDARHIENISVATAGMKWAIGGWQRTNGALFQCVFAFKLPHDVSIDRLRGAWHMFIRRHEILRSTFATAPGGVDPRIVTFSKDFVFHHWHEELVEDAWFYRTLMDRLKQQVSNPLPISRPPIRATLFSSSKKACLILHIHHFQYDAWSMQTLLNDLSSIYHYQDPLANSDLRSFTSLFSPNKQRLDVQRNYWQHTLPTPFTPSSFPSLLKHAPLLAPSGQRRVVIVSGVVTAASSCERRARALGVTLQTVLLAAWARVQARYASAPNATFGIWQVGRSGHVEDIERLAIPCVNVLPIHIDASGSLIDVTKRIQMDLSARLAEPLIERSDLVEIAKWVQPPVGQALFNVNVNVVKVPTTLQKNGLFEPLKAPYYVPNIAIPTVTPTLDTLAVSSLAQNDVVVDIAIVEQTDSILMAIEVADSMMTEEQASGIIGEWASVVESALSMV
ncbi:peptide synthetase [Coprinopsis sp. MPI-PUGE-AT-0042]|nr:peptide synthetase [Coprinopsis sp. MPI-PUGE-AT-0042]